MTPSIDIPAVLAGGYILGSLPFGLILTRLAGLGDLRRIGSGNIGATNVLRTGRKDLAFLTLVLDSGKAALAAIITALVFSVAFGAPLPILAGTAAVVGHNFPVWLKFRGGKGVAATVGLMLATAWPVGLAAMGLWVLVAATTRYSSLAALTAFTAVPFIAWGLATPVHAGAYAALAILSYLRHRENLKRLWRGEESRIGAKKDKPPS